MAVDLTSLVVIIIAGLSASVLVLIFVVICYCLSRKHLDETLRWSRRRRHGAPTKQQAINKAKTELVFDKPNHQDDAFRPQNVFGGQMYLPGAAPRPVMGHYNNAAALSRPTGLITGRPLIPPGGYPRAQFDVGGANRGLSNAIQRRMEPVLNRSRSLEDVLDALNFHDDEPRRKTKKSKKVKHRQSNGVDDTTGGAIPVMGFPPRGVALAYTPQFLPPVAVQPASNVFPIPAQTAAFQPAAVVPQATSNVLVGASPPVAAGGQHQPVSSQSSTTGSETSWTRVGNAGNGSVGSGSSGTSADGGFGRQQAVFAPGRLGAFQASDARRQYEDQERVLSAANSTRFR